MDDAAKLTVREICKSTVVDATVSEIWNAWTTAEGARTFFAPEAHIELEKGGPYELYFELEAPEGSRGSEGCTLLEFTPNAYLSFTWSFPPTIPTLRGRHTTVGVGLQALEGEQTRVVLTHTGWQVGDDWNEGFAYFQRAWSLVLARLKHRFEVGPIDWSEPFTPDL